MTSSGNDLAVQIESVASVNASYLVEALGTASGGTPAIRVSGGEIGKTPNEIQPWHEYDQGAKTTPCAYYYGDVWACLNITRVADVVIETTNYQQFAISVVPVSYGNLGRSRNVSTVFFNDLGPGKEIRIKQDGIEETEKILKNGSSVSYQGGALLKKTDMKVEVWSPTKATNWRLYLNNPSIGYPTVLVECEPQTKSWRTALKKTGFKEGETKKAYCDSDSGNGFWEIYRAGDSASNKEFTLHLKP